MRDLLVALLRHLKYDSGKRHGYRTISPDEVRTMDEIYRDIYSRIYDSARIEPNEELQLNSYWINQPVNSPLDAGTIRSMIDAAERETFAGRTQRLRPDAKVFLLINLLQMVAVPVLASGKGRNLELGRLLFDDTITLMRRAAEKRRGRV